ncbi:MAG: type II secretion system protein [Roseibacillus sp.]
MRTRSKSSERLASRRACRGLTLVELTMVILVILALVVMLFVGARGWKNGTDRARCILNIRQMQMSIRAYSSATEYQPGTDLSMKIPSVNLLAELVGVGKYVPVLPRCPGNGTYEFGGDVVPEIGSLYMRCSLASQGHEPESIASW